MLPGSAAEDKVANDSDHTNAEGLGGEGRPTTTVMFPEDY
jgi:hypothetical protein